LPDKILEEVALVLGQQELLGLLNDNSCILDKLPALLGKLVGRILQNLALEEAVEGNVDLVVL
jgi:hypothetical protein